MMQEFSNINTFVDECKDICSRGIDIYIVGAGEYGRKIADILVGNEIPLKAFIDKKGKSVSAICYEECKDREAFFIISSFIYKKQMLDDLRSIAGVADTANVVSFDYHIMEFFAERRGILADEAMKFLLRKYDFNTVLDVGCGSGIHSEIFLQNGKTVTALDSDGNSCSLIDKKRNSDRFSHIVADIGAFKSTGTWECVWCSHVLEHQADPHSFLKKIHALVKEDGILAVTVPLDDGIVCGGHVSLWNAGLLLYHLVLAGFNCRNAHIKTYGYNISVILKKQSINVMKTEGFSAGSIREIRDFLPSGIYFMELKDDDHFWGNIECMNWD